MTDLRLRAASLDDAQRLWGWRNDGDVRANSFSPDPVEWTEHLVWLEKKRADVLCRLWVLELGDVAVGQIRYDAHQDEAEISFSIAPEYRRRGLGAAALQASAGVACRELNVRSVVGFVKEENVASFRAFERAGFHLVERCVHRGAACRRYEWSCSAKERQA